MIKEENHHHKKTRPLIKGKSYTLISPLAMPRLAYSSTVMTFMGNPLTTFTFRIIGARELLINTYR